MSIKTWAFSAILLSTLPATGSELLQTNLDLIASQIVHRSGEATPNEKVSAKPSPDIRDPSVDATTRKPSGIQINVRLNEPKKLLLGASGGAALIGKVLRKVD